MSEHDNQARARIMRDMIWAIDEVFESITRDNEGKMIQATTKGREADRLRDYEDDAKQYSP